VKQADLALDDEVGIATDVGDDEDGLDEAHFFGRKLGNWEIGNGEWGMGLRIRDSGFGIRDSGFGRRET
jgi:hypothetical protein